MPDPTLTDDERNAFCAEITTGRGLDYSFVFENVPLHFVYKDKVIPGELTDLEKRNKTITETLWVDGYNLYNYVPWLYLYQGRVLQLPLQAYRVGTGAFAPPPTESSRAYAAVEEVKANFEAWMADTGWQMSEHNRMNAPGGGWRSLLGSPGRTMRIASTIAVGNQVLVETIITWSEGGTVKEAPMAVALIYDVDGTVMQDRSYLDHENWPRGVGRELPPQPQGDQPQGAGLVDVYYDFHKTRRIDVDVSDLEKRNLSIVERAWVGAYNTDLEASLYHSRRFRMQLPLQKCSYSLETARDVEATVKEAAPDREMRLALTYAKGNQVVAEGLVSWTGDGVRKEAPFLSFLLLDDDGLIIRDRRYLTLANWPGGDKVTARLGL